MFVNIVKHSLSESVRGVVKEEYLVMIIFFLILNENINVCCGYLLEASRQKGGKRQIPELSTNTPPQQLLCLR